MLFRSFSLGRYLFNYNIPLANASDENKEKDEKKKKYEAKEIEIETYVEKNKAEGSILLQNAKIITMKGKEIIENGEILIKDSRIIEVGESGSVQVGSDVQKLDLSGKTIVPGFVDTHAHVRVTRGVHKNEIWSFAANLAYGVTTKIGRAHV